MSLKVCPSPDVYVHDIELNMTHMVILASDGVWGVVSTDEAVLTVARAIEDHRKGV